MHQFACPRARIEALPLSLELLPDKVHQFSCPLERTVQTLLPLSLPWLNMIKPQKVYMLFSRSQREERNLHGPRRQRPHRGHQRLL